MKEYRTWTDDTPHMMSESINYIAEEEGWRLHSIIPYADRPGKPGFVIVMERDAPEEEEEV